MSSPNPDPSTTFPARFRALSHRDAPLLWGPFFSTPSLRLADMFAAQAARAGFSCVCLDAEHGPLDRRDVDELTLAFRAHGVPILVRPPSGQGDHILAALDSGADGVMVPHITSGAGARAAVAAATYTSEEVNGLRGFSGSTRAAGYGRGMAEHIARSNAARIVIGQVEDREALDDIDAIVATPGLDCVFIGRSDLTVSLGLADRNAPEVLDAVEMVARLACEAGKVVGTFTADLAELPRWRALGVNFFLFGSEVGWLRAGAAAFGEAVRSADTNDDTGADTGKDPVG